MKNIEERRVRVTTTKSSWKLERKDDVGDGLLLLDLAREVKEVFVLLLQRPKNVILEGLV